MVKITGKEVLFGLAGLLLRDTSESDRKPRASKPYVGGARIADEVLPKSDQPQIEVLDSGVRISIDDLVLTESVVDQPWFRQKWYTDTELQIIQADEKNDIQPVMRENGPRKYGGMFNYWHIFDATGALFYFASQPNPVTEAPETRIRFSTVLTGNGHDRKEDDPDHQRLEAAWFEAVKQGDDDSRRQIAVELTELRKGLKKDTKESLLDYLAQYGSSLSRSEFNKTKRQILDAVHNRYHMTRFSNEEVYAVSMGKAYRPVPGDNPLLMLERGTIKNGDGYVNLKDVGPFEFLMQTQAAFDNTTPIIIDRIEYTVGQRLTEKFGQLNVKTKSMSRAVMLLTAGKRIFSGEYSAQSINNHRKRKYQRKTSYQPGTDDYLGLAIISRDAMLGASLDLLEKSIELYEQDNHIQSVKPKIDAIIKRRMHGDSGYYLRATSGGSIERLILYDLVGSSLFDQLDRDNPVDRENNYLMARELHMIIGRYKQPGVKPLYTLPGFNTLIKLQPALIDQIAEIVHNYPAPSSKGFARRFGLTSW